VQVETWTDVFIMIKSHGFPLSYAVKSYWKLHSHAMLIASKVDTA